MGGGNVNNKTRVALKGGSKIFLRNRALGYVSNNVPAVWHYNKRRKDTIIVTCIGRSYQMYNLSHFRLLHVGKAHPDKITVMAMDDRHIYTAANKWIYAWENGKFMSRTYRGNKHHIHLLLPFGNHLIAVDRANVVKVWEIENETIYLEISFNDDEFRITAIAHPPTYLNKIILGSEQGLLQLWNLRSNRLLYTFKGHRSKVTCIEPSTALDVVGVGHADGEIILLNIKYDEVLMNFKQDWGPIVQISFRSDGPPIMAASSSTGYIAFWNLEKKKVANQIQAHLNSVTTAAFMPNEPLLFTTSPDNSMKTWIFDMPGGGGRLLRIREGHSAPSLCIRYHGGSGKSILSAGEDASLRVFSTVSETLNASMGRASINRKASRKKNRFQKDERLMTPIIEFTSETTREIEWDNIACIHMNTAETTTWSFHNMCMGEHRLKPPKLTQEQINDSKTQTTCVTLTHCGNFVIIGYSNGSVERFNIQSGIHRGSYGSPAHKAAIRGVACDNLNQFVVTGCDDGFLKFWRFSTKVTQLLSKLSFDNGITLMRSHRESGMIAVVLASFVINVVDSDTKVVVRRFEGHKARVNDVTFSPDSRWLISAAMDSMIKVWDIPSSYMIDHFMTERPCISLSMSPTGDYLATTHVNFLGIYLWTNKTLFNQVTLRSIDPHSMASLTELPAPNVDDGTLETIMEELTIDDNNEDGEAVNAEYQSPAQLSHELITLSGLPPSRWQNLLDLDIVKKRNKPKAPPTKPKQAPFFLPTISGMEFKFDLSAVTAEPGSKIVKQTSFNNLTKFGQQLEETSTSSDFEQCVNYLKELGPSRVDYEIKSLHPFGGGTYLAMEQFLRMIEYMLNLNTNFELSQSYLSAFLRVHGSQLIEQPEIMAALKTVSDAQERCWQRMESELLYGLGIVSALRNFAH